MKVLVTGAAGFIGYHLCNSLLRDQYEVIGLDNLNAYYGQQLKYDRLKGLGVTREEIIKSGKAQGNQGFNFYYVDLTDRFGLASIFSEYKPEIVIHMAAQAGVRYSIDHPQTFIESNVQGFFNLLEMCRKYPVQHLIYASSSSVYGANKDIPFRESDRTAHPVSLYGATKKAGEVLTHAYVELYKIPSTGLRFFTVYGPWGRPDMAYYKFADHIMQGKSIDVYNHGRMERDFTYIDDIIAGLRALIFLPPDPNNESLHRILNIGRSHPVNLLTFIEILEKYLGKSAQKNYLSMQPGDVLSTWADTSELQKLTGYAPAVDLDEGIRKFVEWYASYHGLPSSFKS